VLVEDGQRVFNVVPTHLIRKKTASRTGSGLNGPDPSEKEQQRIQQENILIAKQNIKIDDKVLIKKLQKLNEDNAVG
jgi:hypothetical protein